MTISLATVPDGKPDAQVVVPVENVVDRNAACADVPTVDRNPMIKSFLTVLESGNTGSIRQWY